MLTLPTTSWKNGVMFRMCAAENTGFSIFRCRLWRRSSVASSPGPRIRWVELCPGEAISLGAGHKRYHGRVGAFPPAVELMVLHEYGVHRLDVVHVQPSGLYKHNRFESATVDVEALGDVHRGRS